jgi:hypothetical protein
MLKSVKIIIKAKKEESFLNLPPKNNQNKIIKNK